MSRDTKTGSLVAERSAIRAALGRFGLLYIVLFVVLPAVLFFSFPTDPFYTLWVEHTHAERLQSTFGFALDSQMTVLPNGTRQALPVIAQVTPGGRFAGLGVQPGDVVVCLYHGRGDFWSELLLAEKGYEATVHVLGVDDLGRGCGGARTVRLPGRQRPRGM